MIPPFQHVRWVSLPLNPSYNYSQGGVTPVSSSQERTARSFVERHGLWNDEQFEAAARADKWIEDHGLEVVRFSFPDQHGILRGKTMVASEAARVMRNGCSITTDPSCQGYRAQDR